MFSPEFHPKIDHNEGVIPTNQYQAAHTLFPSDIDDEYGGGFIVDDGAEENLKAKLCRKNITNEMWKSYLNYRADKETSNSDDNFSGLSE